MALLPALGERSGGARPPAPWVQLPVVAAAPQSRVNPIRSSHAAVVANHDRPAGPARHVGVRRVTGGAVHEDAIKLAATSSQRDWKIILNSSEKPMGNIHRPRTRSRGSGHPKEGHRGFEPTNSAHSECHGQANNTTPHRAAHRQPDDQQFNKVKGRVRGLEYWSALGLTGTRAGGGA